MPRFFLCMAISVLLPLSIFCQNNCDDLNLAAGLSAASAFGYGTDAYLAFDADATGTYWGCPSGVSYPTIGINLGTEHGLCHFRFKFGSGQFPTSYVIQGGNDFSGWVTLSVNNSNTNAIIEGDIEPGKDPYKMYQMVIINADRAYALYDVKLFGWADNTIPTISVTSPNTTDTYYAGGTVPLTVNTSVVGGGTVTQVDYYKDNTGVSIATSTTAPFSASWTNVPAATYTITAKATTSLSKTKTSSPVLITVQAQPSYMRNWLLSGTNLNNTNTGTVFIGTAPAGAATIADAKLLVYGNMYAQKLTVKANWADYVFNKGYNLRPLSEVESYISKHKHLPDVPSTKQIEEKGVSVGDNQAILLRKIEELTLYLIQQNKKIKKLQQQAVIQNRKIRTLSANK